MQESRAAIFRAQCFFAALEYPPTRFELITHAETDNKNLSIADLEQEIENGVKEGLFVYKKGRYAFAGSEELISEHREREALFPRKIRRAKQFTRILVHLSGVKAVYVCNTLALAHAKEESDIDLFIVCKKHTVWQTRFFATLVLMLLRWRVEGPQKDPICLTYFVDESALDLSSVAIENDLYLQHWFLSLLPLYDDGINAALWQQNQILRRRYPYAQPWIPLAGVVSKTPFLHLPVFAWIERVTRKLSEYKFAPQIRERLEKGTGVIANDHVLKFHVDDRREYYRDQYLKYCQHYEV